MKIISFMNDIIKRQLYFFFSDDFPSNFEDFRGFDFSFRDNYFWDLVTLELKSLLVF